MAQALTTEMKIIIGAALLGTAFGGLIGSTWFVGHDFAVWAGAVAGSVIAASCIACKRLV